MRPRFVGAAPSATLLVVAPLAAALALAACGPSVPTRFVLEREIGEWTYRRYQEVLDVEIAISGNPARGHTATYIRRPRNRRDAVPFVNVFVTVYERPHGLTAEVRRQVRGLSTYDAEVVDRAGGRHWQLDGGPGDRWALWVSQNRVVKIGVSDQLERVPDAILSAYFGLYPSDLDEFGRARSGALSGGETEEAAPASEDGSEDTLDLPASMQGADDDGGQTEATDEP